MPIPQRIARLNRKLTNPIARSFAGRVPPFAIVVHRGRKSGREYRTPVIAWHSLEGYMIALTYGSDSDWVKNVEAAGGCALEIAGKRVDLTDPAVVRDATARGELPGAVRPVLSALGVDEFLRLAETEVDGN